MDGIITGSDGNREIEDVVKNMVYRFGILMQLLIGKKDSLTPWRGTESESWMGEMSNFVISPCLSKCSKCMHNEYDEEFVILMTQQI